MTHWRKSCERDDSLRSHLRDLGFRGTARLQLPKRTNLLQKVLCYGSLMWRMLEARAMHSS